MLPLNFPLADVPVPLVPFPLFTHGFLFTAQKLQKNPEPTHFPVSNVVTSDTAVVFSGEMGLAAQLED